MSDATKVRIELVGTSPLLMHNPQLVDPDCDITRQIKQLTGKRKKTDDDLRQIEKLEWYGGLFIGDTPPLKGIVVQPTSKVRKCISEAAKISRMGKQVERALTLSDVYVPLAYDGPTNIDELYTRDEFHSRLSVGIGQKRVMRVRPKFFPWALAVDGMLIESAMNFEDLERIVDLAGIIEGIGDNRVNGYGRFEGKLFRADGAE